MLDAVAIVLAIDGLQLHAHLGQRALLDVEDVGHGVDGHAEAAGGLVDEITDFTSGEDTIFIQGAGSEATVTYDATTGIVSVNNQAFLQLDPGLSIDNDDFLIT